MVAKVGKIMLETSKLEPLRNLQGQFAFCGKLLGQSCQAMTI